MGVRLLITVLVAFGSACNADSNGAVIAGVVDAEPDGAGDASGLEDAAASVDSDAEGIDGDGSGVADTSDPDGAPDAESTDTPTDPAADDIDAADIPEVASDSAADTGDPDIADTAPVDGDTSDVPPSDADTDVEPTDTEPPDVAPDLPPPCEAPLIRGVGAPLVELNECGRLSYGLYANVGQDNTVHRIPDYSFAGYMQGGVPLPTAEVVAMVSPGDGDARERIQEAIDAVSARTPGPDGLRGALLLTRGTYEVGDTLHITADGVVLRGEGQGADGTVLVATRRAQHDLIRVAGSAGLREVDGTRTPITSEYVPVGATTFDVASADGLASGSRIAVLRTPNDRWIDELDMGRWGWTAER